MNYKYYRSSHISLMRKKKLAIIDVLASNETSSVQQNLAPSSNMDKKEDVVSKR